MGNFIKASYAAITATYGFLTPDLWTKIEVCPPSLLSNPRARVLIRRPCTPSPPQPSPSPFEEFSSHLQLAAKKVY